MQKIYHVFVSSTYTDLRDERQRLSLALSKAGYVAEGMELFPASSENQFEFIKRVIDRCDYYVVVVAGRYGSLSEGGVSFTEREYEYAASRGLPTLAFLHRDPNNIPKGQTETKPQLSAKLRAFRTRLQKSAMVDFWDTAEALATSVVVAVGQETNIRPGLGWVRGDNAIDPRILEELALSQKRIVELEGRLAQREDDQVHFPSTITSIDSQTEITISEAGPDGETSNKSHVYRLTWKEIFILFPNEIAWGVEQNAFLQQLAEVLHAYKQKNGSKLTGRLKLETPEFRLRWQFEALGLLVTEASDPAPGQPARRITWRLSDKGRKYFSQIMAVKPQ